MKRILFLAIFAVLTISVSAQPPRGGERIEALKVAYITEILKLTPEEAQQFWPLYNTYTNELKKVRQTNKEDELKFQEEALEVKKRYKPEFKKILKDDDRVNKVFKAEGDFRAMVQKELEKRIQQRQQRMGGGMPPPPKE
jgi:hypothetical protein